MLIFLWTIYFCCIAVVLITFIVSTIMFFNVSPAKLYNKLIVGSAVSEADNEAILAKTSRGFKLMETAISAGTFDKQANTKRKIEAILAVKDQILTMISGQ